LRTEGGGGDRERQEQFHVSMITVCGKRGREPRPSRRCRWQYTVRYRK
jgi:hypothetical protein